MSKDYAHAAGQGGDKSVGASDVQRSRTGNAQPKGADAGRHDDAVEVRPPPSGDFYSKDVLEMSDEELRRLCAARLAEQLDLGSSLVQRCEHLAALPKGDRAKSLFAAARLIGAGAQAAKAFADVAQVERRRRTIVEHIQPPVTRSNDSNSSLQGKMIDELENKILGYMKLYAEETYDPVLKEAADRAAKTAAEAGTGPAA